LNQPLWQVEVHIPPLHERAATLSVEQLRPSAPQFSTSVSISSAGSQRTPRPQTQGPVPEHVQRVEP
jgi:hypothetical protein